MLVRASTAKQRYAQPGGHASRQRRTGHTQAGKLEQLSCGLLRCARCTQAYRLNSARFSWPYQGGARKVGSSQALADPRRLCRPCTGYAKEETADQPLTIAGLTLTKAAMQSLSRRRSPKNPDAEQRRPRRQTNPSTLKREAALEPSLFTLPIHIQGFTRVSGIPVAG